MLLAEGDTEVEGRLAIERGRGANRVDRGRFRHCRAALGCTFTEVHLDHRGLVLDEDGLVEEHATECPQVAARHEHGSVATRGLARTPVLSVLDISYREHRCISVETVNKILGETVEVDTAIACYHCRGTGYVFECGLSRDVEEGDKHSVPKCCGAYSVEGARIHFEPGSKCFLLHLQREEVVSNVADEGLGTGNHCGVSTCVREAQERIELLDT